MTETAFTLNPIAEMFVDHSENYSRAVKCAALNGLVFAVNMNVIALASMAVAQKLRTGEPIEEEERTIDHYNEMMAADQEGKDRNEALHKMGFDAPVEPRDRALPLLAIRAWAVDRISELAVTRAETFATISETFAWLSSQEASLTAADKLQIRRDSEKTRVKPEVLEAATLGLRKRWKEFQRKQGIEIVEMCDDWRSSVEEHPTHEDAAATFDKLSGGTQHRIVVKMINRVQSIVTRLMRNISKPEVIGEIIEVEAEIKRLTGLHDASNYPYTELELTQKLPKPNEYQSIFMDAPGKVVKAH